MLAKNKINLGSFSPRNINFKIQNKILTNLTYHIIGYFDQQPAKTSDSNYCNHMSIS